MQGLLDLLDVPYVGAGVLASSLSMDKAVFKDLMAAHGVPQGDYAVVRAGGRADHVRPAGVREARAAGVVGGHLEGGQRGRARPGARAGVRARPGGGDRAAGRAAWRSSARCSATADPQASTPGRDRDPGATGTTTRRSTPTAGWSWSCRPARPHLEDVRRLAVEVFKIVGCAGMARVDFFVTEDGRARQRAQHDPRLHGHERVREALGRERRALSRSCWTGCWSWRWSGTRPSAATGTSASSASSLMVTLPPSGSSEIQSR